MDGNTSDSGNVTLSIPEKCHDALGCFPIPFFGMRPVLVLPSRIFCAASIMVEVSNFTRVFVPSQMVTGRSVFGLPERFRKRLRTSNSIERLNEEIRRRERVIRIFPNEQSIIRLLGALLIEQHEKWSTGKRYFNMTDYKSPERNSINVKELVKKQSQ